MEKQSNKWEANTKKNTKKLAMWTSAWVFSMAIASFGPTFLWNDNQLISGIFILINTLIGVGMILMNRKYINELDELYRKITMDAMGISLGVGVIGGLSYSMLDTTNIISYDAEISHLVLLIGITYLVSIVIGNARYK